jgi:NADH:ubiquinone oxidoreductase subunit 6 (subunit J)
VESTGVVVAFWVLSAITVGGALLVLLSRNLLHALVFLVLAFLGTAGLFLTLSADFLAVAQVLIYAGAISVLMVFAIMLTPLASRDNASSLYAVPGVLLGAAMAALVAFAALDVGWPELEGAALEQRATDLGSAVAAIGEELLGRYVLAFEVASVLLLFALIGAIVLVREDEPAGDAEQGRTP